MQTTDIQALNDSFGIRDHISITSGVDNRIQAQIRNSFANATINLYGAQVLTFQPHNQKPVLWGTPPAPIETGKAVRAGIPICWPWFGPHPSNPEMPAHGLVRTAHWNILSTAVQTDGATQIRMRLDNSNLTQINWQAKFDLRCVVTVGSSLTVELIMRNPGQAPYTCTGALHSYFAISDISTIRILGLEDTAYIDKVDGDQRKQQHGPISFDGETDRIYLDTTAACVIDDAGLQRRIVVEKSGSRTTVVWNPGSEKSKRFADLQPDDYVRFVCVETANAADDTITVAPGGEHRLITTISVES